MVAGLEFCHEDLRQRTQLDLDELSVSFDVVPSQMAPIDLAYFGARSIGLLKPYCPFALVLWRPDEDNTPRWAIGSYYPKAWHGPTS